MLSFEELTDARRLLQSFCLQHIPSLLSLQSGISFKLLPDEPSLGKKKVRHLTTTATCLSSLRDSPLKSSPQDWERVNDLQIKFSKKSLARADWTSEGSAGVYCRCRALPTVLNALSSFDKRIEKHLKAILSQLDSKSQRFGVGEAGSELRERLWYPPNAFHTYWTLDILEIIQRKSRTDYERLSRSNALDLDRKREGMILWGRQQLGSQLGLHSASPPSSVLDSDQLAWSLAILLRFDETLNVNLEGRDFIKQVLKCLFSTQTDGTWRHYKPLFHYTEAGNAYCYVFETFAVLLQCALNQGEKAKMIRELLKPYSKNLMDLWRYAESTKIPLYPGSKDIGWCSGHRTNVTLRESWATASVFSYAQELRRLIGIWCREEAENNLDTPRNRLTPKKAAALISSRGKTWGVNKTTVSEQLWTMFINPVQMHDCAAECSGALEPDSQPIKETQARSAILFGPPGTSKTTLVRGLADVIGWKYVEIHASHFVAAGLTQVQKTADDIFKQLSELDHAVVLFDEIDELVRERDMEKDAFGRFLTTSMLPKLAELWEARKILYFVATNHINYFDSAIIRSHRFDALILVSPPSFRSKVRELESLLVKTQGLRKVRLLIKESDVQKALANVKPPQTKNGEEVHAAMAEAKWREEQLDPKNVLAKFALLRWDELNELAYRLAKILKSLSRIPRNIPPDLIKDALVQIADPEWRKNKSYVDYLRDTRSERRDYEMLNVWEFKTKDKRPVPGLISAKGTMWLAKAVDSTNDIELDGYTLRFKSGGKVDIRPVHRKR